MGGIMLFLLGMALGFTVSHWWFLLCVIPILAGAEGGRRG